MTTRLIFEAEHLLRAGNPDAAIHRLKQALTEDPEQAEAHALLAAVLLAQERTHAAAHEAKLALQLDPNQVMGRIVEIQTLLLRRKFNQVSQRINELEALEPALPHSHQMRAQLCQLQDRHKEAMVHLERALSMDPDNIDVRTDLAENLFQNGDWNKAEEVAKTVLEQQSDHADGLALMGLIHLSRGETELAESIARSILIENAEHRQGQRLLIAIKTRRNWFLGAWWRFQSWISRYGANRAILILVVAYAFFRMVDGYLAYHELASARGLGQLIWLGLCAYTWVAPALFSAA